MLRAAAPLFEGVPVNAMEWAGSFDHLPDRARDEGLRPGDVLLSRAATIESVRFVETDGIGRLVAKMVFDDDQDRLRAKMRGEHQRNGNVTTIGLSIDAVGDVEAGIAEGRSGKIVREIQRVESVDLVSRPAAGGRIDRLVASRPASTADQEDDMGWDTVVAALKERGILKEANASWSHADAAKAVGDAIGGLTAADVAKLKLTENLEDLMAAKELIMNGDLEGALAHLDRAIAEYQGGDEAPAAPPAAPAAPPESRHREAADATADIRAKFEAELKKLAEMRAENEKIVAEAARERREIAIDRAVADADLPGVVAKRLARTLKASSADDDAVRSAIKEAREELEALDPSGEVYGLGRAGRIEVGTEQRDKYQAALDGLVLGRDVGPDFTFDSGDDVDIAEARCRESVYGGAAMRPYPKWQIAGWRGDKVPRFRSLKEAYAAFHGRMPIGNVRPERVLGEAVHGKYVPYNSPDRDDRIRESRSLLRENIQVSDWAQALGDSVTRAMMRAYGEDEHNKWRWIVGPHTKTVKDFRTQRRVRMGGFGALATVAETATYPTSADGTPGDEEATYAIAKRGLISPLTLEAVANDDIGAVQTIPRELGRSAAITLHDFVFDFLRTNAATSYDATALAASGHNNLIATALTKANADVARRLMLEQSAFGNAASFYGMSNLPAFLCVPAELEDIAFRLGTSEVFVEGEAAGNVGAGTREPNLHRGLRPIVLSYWTDADNYWFVADPSKQNTIEVGFFGGREEPELFVQDSETVGSNFTADRLSYKLRHIYGGAVLDHRAFVGGIVP